MVNSNKLFLTIIILIFGITSLSIPHYILGDKLKGAKKEKPSFENHATTDTKSIAENNNIRPPTVAGSFYPADAEELERLVDGLLKKAKKDLDDNILREHVLMILAPHAGYDFSGRTAAYAFAPIMGKEYDTVILLGSPHRVPVNGAAVY